MTTEFSALCSRFEAVVNGQPLTPANITLLVMKSIRFVESIASETGDRGAAKKDLCLRLIQHLVSLVPESDNKQLLQLAVEQIAPGLIDGLIDADHGRLLQQITKSKGFRKIFSCCFSPSAAAEE